MIKLTDAYYRISELNCKVSEVPEALRFMLEENVIFRIPFPTNSDSKYNDGLTTMSAIFDFFEMEEVDNQDILNEYLNYSLVGAKNDSNFYNNVTYKDSNLFTNFIKYVEEISLSLYENYYKNKYVESDSENSDILSFNKFNEQIIDFSDIFFKSSGLKFDNENIISDYLTSILDNDYSLNNKQILNIVIKKNKKLFVDVDLKYLDSKDNKFKCNVIPYIMFDKQIVSDKYFNETSLEYTNKNASELFDLFGTALNDCIIKNDYLSLNILEPYDYDEVKLQKRFNKIVIKWSDVQTKNINFSSTYLKEQIRHRYHLQDRPTSGSLNTIIDSFLPSALYNCNMDSEKIKKQYSYALSKSAYAISPYVANLFGIRRVDTRQLCRILGFDEKKIKSMLLDIKIKKLDFVFVGAGGTGINTAIWLKELCDFSNISGLFNRVHCFEEDNVEISNLLRFPLDPHSIIVDGDTPSGAVIDITSKLHLIKNAAMQLSSNVPTLVTKFICKDENKITDYPSTIFMNNMQTLIKDDGDFESTNSFRTRDNVILYGAPDIATRINLTKAGRFISATHATNSCNVYINPIQDSTIQVESYGMIQLAPFFMNQLRMTISLLEILSSDNLDELLSEQDKSVLEYSFDGKSVLKTDRIYNFNIDRNISMLTEDQAQNAGN